jgi:hypothetical protein
VAPAERACLPACARAKHRNRHNRERERERERRQGVWGHVVCWRQGWVSRRGANRQPRVGNGEEART